MSNFEGKGDRDRTVSENSEHEFDPQFKPIVTLPEIEIYTNEEEEDVMLKLRAKLFRFDTKSDDTPEWKERGTGELKILKHKEKKTVRIVMRRDKTLKVCANHYIKSDMELKPSCGSDRAFVYTVLADFADETPKAECLAIRFGTVDNANQFKEKFNEAKEFLKALEEEECGNKSKESIVSINSVENKENEGNAENTNKKENEVEKNENIIIQKTNSCEEVAKKLSNLDVNEGNSNNIADIK